VPRRGRCRTLTSDRGPDPSPPPADPAARAGALGRQLATLIDEPEEFVEVLEAGLAALSDPDHAVTLRRVSPDVETFHAVPSPLVRAIESPIKAELRQGSSATALSLAGQLERADVREVRMFARPCLLRALPDEPERAWQIMRRLAARAADWIEVDAFAQAWAVGVLAEPFRWAELEQLVYSPAVMERRLIGSTLATMTHVLKGSARPRLAPELAPRAIALVGTLIGDAEPAVQKALSWALRSWHALAPDAVEPFLREQASIARAQGDGHRAWVVRDALPAVPPTVAVELRAQLGDVRRRPGAPSSSTAAAIAARYGIATGVLVAAGQGERYARARG
jgi:hypothetical protein